MTAWHPSRRRPPSGPQDIHLWRIALDVPAAPLDVLGALLDAGETARAARLATAALRRRFVTAHAGVRGVLACYLAVQPESLVFTAGVHGKPALAAGGPVFNLSHSGDLAICAVAAHGRLGVDVELIRSVPDADGIADGLFAPQEAAQYAACDAGVRQAAFFSAWTRKEAILKASGDGFHRPLDSFAVDIAPAVERPSVIGAGEETTVWRLRSFSPAPGYAGAVVLDREIARLELFDWPHDATTRVEPPGSRHAVTVPAAHRSL